MPTNRQLSWGGPMNIRFVRLGIVAFALGMWQPLTLAAQPQGQGQGLLPGVGKGEHEKVEISPIQ